VFKVLPEGTSCNTITRKCCQTKILSCTDSEEILYQNEFMIFRSIDTFKTLITKNSEVFSILDTRSVHSKILKYFAYWIYVLLMQTYM